MRVSKPRNPWNTYVAKFWKAKDTELVSSMRLYGHEYAAMARVTPLVVLVAVIMVFVAITSLQRGRLTLEATRTLNSTAGLTIYTYTNQLSGCISGLDHVISLMWPCISGAKRKCEMDDRDRRFLKTRLNAPCLEAVPVLAALTRACTMKPYKCRTKMRHFGACAKECVLDQLTVTHQVRWTFPLAH